MGGWFHFLADTRQVSLAGAVWWNVNLVFIETHDGPAIS